MLNIDESVVQVVCAASEARNVLDRVSKALQLPEIQGNSQLFSLLSGAFDNLQPAATQLAEAAAAVGHPQQALEKAA